MNSKKLGLIILGLTLGLLTQTSWASSLQEISSNLLVPTSLIGKFLMAACYVMGMAFLLGAFMQFQMYRQNPKLAPLTKIILLALFGIILLLTPYFSTNYADGWKSVQANDARRVPINLAKRVIDEKYKDLEDDDGFSAAAEHFAADDLEDEHEFPEGGHWGSRL